MRSVLATGAGEPSFFQALNLNHDAILNNHCHLPKLQVPQGFLDFPHWLQWLEFRVQFILQGLCGHI
ncbi:MAG TPA: hypothetical protein VKE98_22860 [Gemmataceae bacterium]|nr:hypothetical protein [Gemmataceae bacterium]